ncbi:PASTA domain-containing protein [Actinophytocola sp.]|uniref:PASTA domain-containing protein n=1 Tax=Actinophytocola sp. TaxID=1872138 RepID=UPI002D810B80|nr:PASTA domain-containing protein [Actinophytocola sp.]HET9139429.1 PASTA domain-containing protein [Actinophytocola sp.]
MKSTMRGLTLIGVVVPALLGLGAGTGAAATAPAATLAAASITFTTGDENKDFDTLVRAQVETPAGRVAADVADVGTEYRDNSSHGPFRMTVDTGVTAAMLSPGRFRISIDPVGNDTWRFGYQLTMFFSDGTSFPLTAGNVLQLSESNRELIRPFTLAGEVAVPNVLGRTEPEARAAILDAGLAIGVVSRVIDPTCEAIGLVRQQNPAPGTGVPPGTRVDFTVNRAPRICP